MNFFVDMHCHIIPGVDDGAKDIEETKKMLYMAHRDGIRYIVATPHFHPKRGEASHEELKHQLRLVREEAAKISDKFRIFVGHEVYFGQDIPELIKDKQILTMNGKEFILVEFAPSAGAEELQRGIQQIQMRGYRVVLAHVERYSCLRDDFSMVKYLVDTGVYLQVNADAILGNMGRTIKKFVKKLLEEELVFCVGTDAHDSKKRPPQMKKAAHYVEKKYGEEYARRIFFSNAVSMLKKQK